MIKYIKLHKVRGQKANDTIYFVNNYHLHNSFYDIDKQ